MTLLLLLIVLDFRTWEAQGYQCEARLAAYENGRAQLIRQDNQKLVWVDKQLLSQDDQAYIEMVESLTTTRRWVICGRSVRGKYLNSYQDMFTLRSFVWLETGRGPIQIPAGSLLRKDQELIRQFEQAQIGSRAQEHIDWAKQK